MEIVGMVCKECVEERKAKVQQGLYKKMSELKDRFDRGRDKGYKIWFKAQLTCGDQNEHVWIRVTDINLDDNTFHGIIDNHIVCVSEKYSYGNDITMNFDDIEGMIEEGNYEKDR